MNSVERLPSIAGCGCSSRALAPRRIDAQQLAAPVRETVARARTATHKKNSVMVTCRHLDAVFHLCYNKDTDEPHNLSCMGCTLLLGVKEFTCPRNSYYSTYVRLVNNFFRKERGRLIVM